MVAPTSRGSRDSHEWQDFAEGSVMGQQAARMSGQIRQRRSSREVSPDAPRDGFQDAAQDAEADQLFAAMRSVAVGIQATFGRKCEVVLHDFREQDHSAIAVAGDVTGRAVGSPMSEIGLSLLRQGDDARDKLNYTTRITGGRLIKSSTMLLRTLSDHVVGALCINVDITELRRFAASVTEFMADGEQPKSLEVSTTTFANDMSQIIDSALEKVEASLGLPLDRLTSAEWLEVFRSLDGLGMFQFRRSVPLIAARLGLSRASAYNYISRLRDESAASGD